MFWFGNFYPYIPSNGDDGLGILKAYQGIKQRKDKLLWKCLKIMG